MMRMFPEFETPLWPLLAQVSRPSRYSGSEWRPYSAPPEGRDAFSVCLAFPDVYEIGMSYYGFQALSPFLREICGAAVDRAYCPWVDMERLLRKNSLPLTSVERGIPLADFSLVGFTLQHELTYTNVLTMLDLGGIPLRSEARGDRHPMVVAGGPGAFVPEPMAPFIDLFCVGEGEAILPGLLASLRETRGAKREERLLACSRLPGVYVPGIVRAEPGGNGASFVSLVPLPIRRQFVPSFEKTYLPESMIVPSVAIVHDRAALEIFRGCSRGCRFCQAGMTNRPVRELSPERVVNSALNLARRTGWEEIGLLSLATCDYSAVARVIEKVASQIAGRGIHLSLPSLRMDGFSVELAAQLRGVRRGGLTFAPEAGTQRLRDVINKGITEDAIFACLDEAFSKGWDRIKLYFMMGLPTETQEDLDGIVRLALSVRRLAQGRSRKRASVAVSVAGFVPKAHTPFQWERQNTIEELREKGRRLKSQIKDRALSLNYHEPEQSFLEGILARGDRRLAGVVELAWRKGARFDGWSETFGLSRWLEALEESGLDPADFTRARDRDESLPWDVIDVGVTKAFLWRERTLAYEARLTASCRDACAACGLGCCGKRKPSPEAAQ
jgi:radical SAM family uncharacterized protein